MIVAMQSFVSALNPREHFAGPIAAMKNLKQGKDDIMSMMMSSH
jgi:hypothetical protein